MSSNWKTYVAQNLRLERQVDFTDEERKLIPQIKARLAKGSNPDAWDSLHRELQLMVMKGYSDRKDRIGDCAACVHDIVQYRNQNGIDSLLDRELENQDLYHRSWQSYISGEDEWGHLVSFETVEGIDVPTLETMEEAKLLVLRAQHIEAINYLKRKVSLRMGHRVCKYIYIMDLRGLVMSKHFSKKVREILKPIFKLSGDFYPDSLWTMFLVNAPFVFRMVWRAISPLIDPVVKTKIRIQNSPKEYLKSMQSTGIPMSSIPEEIGGEAVSRPMGEIVREIREERMKNPADEPHYLSPYTFDTNETPPTRAFGSGEGSMGFSQAESQTVFDEDNVLIAGFLNKRGNVVNKEFKSRYFILTPYGLYYFIGKPTRHNHDLRGKIDLHLIVDAKAVPDQDGRTELFDIHVPGRIYHLQVSPENEIDCSAATWAKFIAEAAEDGRCSLEAETSLVVTNQGHEDHIRSGYMMKKGVYNQMWRKRYFVLTSNRLYYYSDRPEKSNSVLKGVIDLHMVSTASQHSVSSSDSKFDVFTPVRVYRLKSLKPHTMEEWVSDINRAVEVEQIAKQEAEELASTLTDHEATQSSSHSVLYRGLSFLSESSVAQVKSVFSPASFTSMIESVNSFAEDVVRAAEEFHVTKDGGSLDQKMALVKRRLKYMFRLSHARSLSREKSGKTMTPIEDSLEELPENYEGMLLNASSKREQESSKRSSKRESSKRSSKRESSKRSSKRESTKRSSKRKSSKRNSLKKPSSLKNEETIA